MKESVLILRAENHVDKPHPHGNSLCRPLDEAGRSRRRDGADAPPVEPESLWRRVAAVLVGMETALDAGLGCVAGLGASPPAVETVRRVGFPTAEKLHLPVSVFSITEIPELGLVVAC